MGTVYWILRTDNLIFPFGTLARNKSWRGIHILNRSLPNCQKHLNRTAGSTTTQSYSNSLKKKNRKRGSFAASTVLGPCWWHVGKRTFSMKIPPISNVSAKCRENVGNFQWKHPRLHQSQVSKQISKKKFELSLRNCLPVSLGVVHLLLMHKHNENRCSAKLRQNLYHKLLSPVVYTDFFLGAQCTDDDDDVHHHHREY